MTLDDTVQEELLATFQVELAEHCQALSRTFLALEKEPDSLERRSLLDTAFRSAHNLKGAARAVAFGTVEALAHGLEGILGAARRGDVELSPALFDLIYAAVDTLGDAFSNQGARAAPDARLNTISEQLEAAQAAFLQKPASGEPLTATPRDAVTTQNGAVSRSPAATGSNLVPAGSGAAETIRLPVARLDSLLEQLGELLIPRLELEDSLAGLATLLGDVAAWQREWRKVRPHLRQLEREGALASLRPLVRFLELNGTHLGSLTPRLSALRDRIAGPMGHLGSLTDDLQTDVKRFHMVPFGHLTDGFERAVRDLARSLGKEARLVLIGSDTELDRRTLQEMKDPLLHLLRNALDHGVEAPTERQRLNKPSIGSVVVAAAQHGGAVVIEIEDDGAGIVPGAIRRVAIECGLVTEAEDAAMSDREALRLVFRAGLSTKLDVTTVSGRGVGLDVVARNVERLGGQVDIESTPGHGTRFVVTLPLTLATARALLVEADGALYAVPMVAVQRVLRAKRLGSMGGQLMLEYEESAIPVAPLASLLDAGAKPASSAPGAALTLAVVAAGTQRVALVIDRVVGEQEILVRPLPFPVLRLRYHAGATILGSGRVVPILNAAELVGAVSTSRPTLVPAQPEVPQLKRRRVLVADDSLTTRTLERYILEAAGYDVELAGDGAEALALLQEKGSDVLVSDVDMPGLDGVALTVRVRAEPKLRDLPVILVTSLDSAGDRERGLQAGADAYIIKSSFDQDQLLRTIRELI